MAFQVQFPVTFIHCDECRVWFMPFENKSLTNLELEIYHIDGCNCPGGIKLTAQVLRIKLGLL